ncbi:MAG: sigma factor-like helix-turn-helix DNA-binding protein, partial [Planctomycetota bacterium]
SASGRSNCPSETRRKKVLHADALWRLMCAITITKARRAARDNFRLRRTPAVETYLDQDTPSQANTGDVTRSIQIPGPDETPLDAAQFAEQMSVLLENLNPQECRVVDMKLQNHSNQEIAQALNCSERTVRRLTTSIRERWNTLFDEDQHS